MATMRPTPRNELLGLLSDAYQWMQSPERTQQMQGFAGLLGTTGVPQTVERMAYGEPLTNIGRANVPLLKPETADALMTVAPFAPKGMKMIRATEGLPVGMSIKDVGNKSINVRLNEASNFLSAKSEFGEVGGTIRPPDQFSDVPYLQINYAEVEKASRGKGKGKELYQSLIDEAQARGLRVFSDSTVEKPAVNVYKSLEKSGYQLKDMTTGRLDDGAVYGSGATNPAFEISSAKSFQAPQQAALDLAQKRAALPVEQGGLGLPSNNTAADRAKAMGFESDYAHGSPISEITKLTPSQTGAQGSGIYATNYFPEANIYSGKEVGATIYPLQVKTDTAYQSGAENPYMKLIVGDDEQLLNALKRLGKESIISEQQPTPEWLKALGTMEMPVREHFVSMNPDLFRSRFAAFDPFRKDVATATAMGVALPDLLAAELPEDELKRNQSAGLLFP